MTKLKTPTTMDQIQINVVELTTLTVARTYN